MKPKRLEFCGINSFSRAATIDFEKLLSGGIFGIFGDTGSGKTTILDSMIFALYGKIDRTRGGSGSEIINYNCDKASVRFDFETETSQGRKTYRVEREIKRKNSMQTLMLYEIAEGKTRAVSEGVKNTNQKIQEIVGLSFEDFKKCIALPQGEFAQFVKADRGERLRLISRLFGLEKYGELLNARLKERYSEVKSAFDLKSGELKGYEDVSDEAVAALNSDLRRMKEEKKELDKEYERFYAEYENAKVLFQRKQRYSDLQRQQSALLEKQAYFEQARAILKQIPAAQQLDLLSKEQLTRQKEISSLTAEIEQNNALKESIGKQLLALQKSFDLEKNALLLEENKSKIDKLFYIKSDYRALSEYQAQRSALKAEYADWQKRAEAARQNVNRLSEQERKENEKLKSVAFDNIDEFLNENLDSALLSNEYRASRKYFEEWLAELHRDFQGGDLFERVDARLQERIGHYESALSKDKTRDTAALLEAYKDMQKTRDSLRTAINSTVLQKEQEYNKLREAQSNLSRIGEEGKLCAKKAEELLNRIRNALNAEALPDLDDLEKSLNEERKSLLDKQNDYETRTAALHEKQREAELKAVKHQERLEHLKIAEQESSVKMQALLKESQIVSLQEAQSLLSQFPDRQALSERIEAYDHSMVAVQAKIEALMHEGAVAAEYSEEDFEKQKAAFAVLTQKKQDVSERVAVYEESLARLRDRAETKKNLESEQKTYGKNLDQLARLRELIRGNNFMEFVAGEYLSDISAAATQTLLKLTGGRYFVRYDQGFFIGDNLCGGELRSVNTLSGGETFLVSLSLALALSAAIYAKSLKPIEFFFLDEGFGTLDEKLIDTVMDSLEKLKNSRFSIGLISHVEELKHRISNKIMVTGAVEGGSSEIQISC